MKSTIQKYGWLVVTILVIAILIGIAGPAAKYIKNSFVDVVDDITNNIPKDIGVPENLTLVDGILSFDPVKDADKYKVKVGDSYETEITETELDISTVLADLNGPVIIKVSAVVGEDVGRAASIEHGIFAPFTVTKDNRNMVGYTGEDNEDLVIPETFKAEDGTWYKVVKINRAFEDCTNLQSVSIPDSVTSIATGYVAGSFQRCTNLKSVTFGENSQLTSISAAAFSGCTMLSEITIPDSVTSIGQSAFLGCTSLTGVNIPNGVTSIGDAAFAGCTGLTSVGPAGSGASIEIPDGVTKFGSVFDGCKGLTNVEIPDTITRIDQYAFRNCSNLTNVKLSNNVTYISHETFENCSKLTSITIPVSLKSTGSYLFYGCSKLKTVYYEGTLEQWCQIGFDSSDANPCYNGAKLYINNELVTDVVIPNTITSIKNNAFSGCASLKSIKTHDGITSVGASAFKYCISLTSIELADNITNIGNSAFDGCTSLTSIKIPDSVTSIGDRTFQSCKKLTSVIIPANTTSFGYVTFTSCSALKNVYYEGTLEQWCQIYFGSISSNPCYYGANLYINDELATDIVIPSTITALRYTFTGCSSLTSVTIPNSITNVSESLFNNCSKLAKVIIPNSVTSIAASAFSDCSGLTSVGPVGSGASIEIPDSVTSIGGNAFYRSRNITTVNIPNTVTSIGAQAFYVCSGLVSAELPAGITDIGQSMFMYCSSLETLTIRATTPPTLASNVFSQCSSLTTIYVPAESVEAYKTASGWSTYAAKIQAIPTT